MGPQSSAFLGSAVTQKLAVTEQSREVSGIFKSNRVPNSHRCHQKTHLHHQKFLGNTHSPDTASRAKLFFFKLGATEQLAHPEAFFCVSPEARNTLCPPSPSALSERPSRIIKAQAKSALTFRGALARRAAPTHPGRLASKSVRD